MYLPRTALAWQVLEEEFKQTERPHSFRVKYYSFPLLRSFQIAIELQIHTALVKWPFPTHTFRPPFLHLLKLKHRFFIAYGFTDQSSQCKGVVLVTTWTQWLDKPQQFKPIKLPNFFPMCPPAFQCLLPSTTCLQDFSFNSPLSLFFLVFLCDSQCAFVSHSLASICLKVLKLKKLSQSFCCLQLLLLFLVQAWVSG